MLKKRNLVRIPLSALLHRSNPDFISSSLSPPQFSLSSSTSPQDSLSSTFPANNYTSLFLQNTLFSLKSFLCSQATNNGVLRCWSCDKVADSTPFLVCEACKSVQPVDSSLDYFQIFGSERKYEIEENLEGKYKNWQKKVHPDLVHTKSEKEREFAAEQSARVTDAYRTLSKPLSRAIYVMRLEGINVDEEKTITEPELLMEIMEIREAVEEASDSQALNQIQSQVQEKMKYWSKSFANAFKDRKFEEALDSIQRMTYYDRVNEEIVKKS
ncbi:Co-chaperone HscB, C-terminal oligomerization domain [Dillenia turbinata]|uniref:Co-chaperone HscB, C-terminal oligomerization domain n=1 Tax=Dillenia turbinata TaxID=194707 RepID=A0AAN8W2I3_9MAGN